MVLMKPVGAYPNWWYLLWGHSTFLAAAVKKIHSYLADKMSKSLSFIFQGMNSSIYESENTIVFKILQTNDANLNNRKESRIMLNNGRQSSYTGLLYNWPRGQTWHISLLIGKFESYFGRQIRIWKFRETESEGWKLQKIWRMF